MAGICKDGGEVTVHGSGQSAMGDRNPGGAGAGATGRRSRLHLPLPGRRAIGLALAVGVLGLGAGGCAFRRLTVNALGNAIAESDSTFATDDDPELVKEALPFSLKLMEALLAESPRHRGLLTAAARGFTQYAYAFVQQDSDELRRTDLARSRELRNRAKKLYLRGRDYGLRGLATRRRGFVEALEHDPRAAVAGLTSADVPLLYWTAAAWVAAVNADKADALLISDLPKVDAMLERALKLDEAFSHGALPTLMIAYETVRQGVEGDPYARAEQRFQRALELSHGKLAAPYVELAEYVCIPTENRERFAQLLGTALAIDPNALPEARLANLLAQSRARWLSGQLEDLFLPPLDPQP
jgi:predicted anti-sigma-YlaC factor YlaD